MSSTGPSFGSNNPFRRKLGTPVSTPTTTAPTESLSSIFSTEAAPSSGASRPPFTTFRSAVSEVERRDEEEQPVQKQPKKITKKVRVQSPPPSSPEDVVPVTRYPALESLDQDSSDDDDSSSGPSGTDDEGGPFNSNHLQIDELPLSASSPSHVPANPFARTLHDIENGVQKEEDSVTGTNKGALDVDSFKRLLLTGHASIPQPAQKAPTPARIVSESGHTQDQFSPDRASNADAVQETPTTTLISGSEELPERTTVLPSSPSPTVASTAGRKKPPPPSSRHGKLITMELGAGANSRDTTHIAPTASFVPPQLVGHSQKPGSGSTTPPYPFSAVTDVNKPLPAPPFRASVEEDAESPFDREAAGKVPEAFAELQANPRPPTPPAITRNRSGSQTSTQSRKPAVPPPRRQSRISSSHSTNPDEDPPRSSMESNRSRTDSLRVTMNPEKSLHPPAPPPPRRPAHARQGSSYTAPSQPSFSPATTPGVVERERSPLGSSATPLTRSLSGLGTTIVGTGSGVVVGHNKSNPPPPPPTRKQSTRRPLSSASMEGGNSAGSVRKVSREKDGGGTPGPPPPPPPRVRGIARPPLNPLPSDKDDIRRGSLDIISTGNGSTLLAEANDDKQGVDILADLDALQKEVEALMKKGTPC
ncbi:hypothetical protein GGS20DRAFT_552422 [Poronia punctata]|nr:hypothetical protein GGS20DRAFT_552422 [Poronia punctata]